MPQSEEKKNNPIFHCTQCGDCCRGYGGTYVSQEEISLIAAHLKVEISNFVKTYCQFSGGRPTLAQAQNEYCIFWDKICTIHPVKPKMCRQWPFIKSVLIDIGNWQVMASACPGMRRDASPEQILEAVHANLARQGQVP